MKAKVTERGGREYYLLLLTNTIRDEKIISYLIMNFYAVDGKIKYGPWE